MNTPQSVIDWLAKRKTNINSPMLAWEKDWGFVALALSYYPNEMHKAALGGYPGDRARQDLKKMHRGYCLFARSVERVQATTFAFAFAQRDALVLPEHHPLAQLDDEVIAAIKWWVEDEDSNDVPEEHMDALISWELAQHDEDDDVELTELGEKAVEAMTNYLYPGQ
jgi:hypothetical protein